MVDRFFKSFGLGDGSLFAKILEFIQDQQP